MKTKNMFELIKLVIVGVILIATMIGSFVIFNFTVADKTLNSFLSLSVAVAMLIIFVYLCRTGRV